MRIDIQKLGVLRVEAARDGKKLTGDAIGKAMAGGEWSRSRVSFHLVRAKHGIPMDPKFIAAFLNAISAILEREVRIDELVMDEDLPAGVGSREKERAA